MKILLVTWVMLFSSLGFCYSQETFSNIYDGLDQLETLMDNLENTNNELQIELKSLSKDYSMLEDSFRASETTLQALRISQNQMSQQYKQLALQLQASEEKLKFWKIFSISGVAVGLSGIAAGLIVSMVQ